jgi:Zn-dependent M28 family amino/carboxypeptidase
MVRPAPLLALLLVSGLVLAGCVSPAAEQGDAPAPAATATDPAVFVPATGAGAIGFLHDYVMTHPFRINSQASFMASARDDLQATLEGFGLSVVRHEYATGVNILAFKNGTTMPEEWIVLSAHYDTTESTVYGAWDDGAGTAMLMELAKSGATKSYNHTIVYAFFDEEEQGLVGSAAFVEEYQTQATFVANLNFDPPGLNWPCKDPQGYLPVKIIFEDAKVEEDLPGYARLKEAVLAGLDAAQVPEEVRDYDSGIPVATLNGVGVKGGSDHQSFGKVDVPNVFIGSAPTSVVGPAAGLTYLLHTPVDTVQQMEARCGGADLLEQAFQVEIDVTSVAVDMIDGHD